MPSFNSITSVTAFAAGGTLAGIGGYRHASRVGMDTEDRLGFTTSSVIAGGAAGYMFKQIGPKRLGQFATGAYNAARFTGKAAMANPLRSLANRVDKTATGRKILDATGIGRGAKAFKGMGGPVAALAMLALGIGAVAYSARSNPKVDAYSSSDGTGGTEYNSQSMKERMGLIGATGDVVFGLNNSRHG